jgi:hypothetical protein
MCAGHLACLHESMAGTKQLCSPQWRLWKAIAAGWDGIPSSLGLTVNMHVVFYVSHALVGKVGLKEHAFMPHALPA